MAKSITSYFNKILFPDMCIMCDERFATNSEDQLCFSCGVNLPWTDHFHKRKNRTTVKFWGRLPCEDAASMLNFYSHSDVKQMVHKLKYEGRKDIGYSLGKIAGTKAQKSNFFDDIDMIVPIPLHSRKEAKRGYNQAASIGEGVSESMGIPMEANMVLKVKDTTSQTKLSRIQRVKNVYDSFRLNTTIPIGGRHILIVDDVLTTGATIEACGNRLLETKGVKVSVLTICIARS